MKKIIASLLFFTVVGFGALLFVKSQSQSAAFPGGSKHIFDQNDQLFLYSLKGDKTPNEKNTFHSYPIVGRTRIENQQLKADLIAQFHTATATDEPIPDCFFPHHAMRAVKGNEVIDLVICFNCQNVKTYYGNQKGFARIAPKAESSFRQALNKVLKEVKIPVDVPDEF